MTERLCGHNLKRGRRTNRLCTAHGWYVAKTKGECPKGNRDEGNPCWVIRVKDANARD